MPQASVTIYGVAAGITAEQAKQKLAKLYNCPEKKFEVVCRSLFTNDQPYLFMKHVEEAEADIHKKRLIKLGFIVNEEDTFAKDESGLHLAPVDAIKTADVDCPACKKPSGGEDICKHCEVIISKFLEHEKFDDQLQSQLKSSAYSQERMKEIREEKIEQKSKIEQTKKLNKVVGKKESDTPNGGSDASTANSTNVENQVIVDSDEKTSKKLYAVVASVCLTILGAGFIAYQIVDDPFSKNKVLAKKDTEISVNSLGALGNLAAPDSTNIELVEFIPETVFDFQVIHQRELNDIEKKIKKLYDENMKFSIAHLISSKEDPREKIFAKQALIKNEEFDQETVGKLEGIHAMLGDLDKDFDRVQMLLSQAGLYNQFELPEEVSELLAQASGIASDLDDSESQIMAKVAFAEYQSLHGDVEEAKASYQHAKNQSSELNPQSLADSAYKYIALSEVNHDLLNPVQSTDESIIATTDLENITHQINEFSANAETANSPDLAAAHGSTEIGDPLIDDLIKMTKQNQQKLKAVSGLLGP